jgi:hypothetical protein
MKELLDDLPEASRMNPQAPYFLTREVLTSLLGNLPTGSAPGADRIRYEVFKYTAPYSACLLAPLFQACWRLEETPRLWKSSRFVAIHKKGDPLQCSNYRGIAVECTLSRIYTRAQLLYMQRAVDPCLAPEQHGFRPAYSTDEALFVAADALVQRSSAKEPLILVMVDLAKADDRVWRKGLWWKCISQMQLPPKVMRVLMESYRDTSGRVKAGGALSSPFPIRTG